MGIDVRKNISVVIQLIAVLSALATPVYLFKGASSVEAQTLRPADTTFDIFRGNNPSIGGGFIDPVSGSVGHRIQGQATAWNTEAGTVANFTKVKVEIPNSVGTSHQLRTTIWADNAAAVVDTLTINTTTSTRLVYVPGHAVVFSPSCPSGCPLSDAALVGAGVTVGDIAAGGSNSAATTFKVDIVEAEVTPTATIIPSNTPTNSPTITTTLVPTQTIAATVTPTVTRTPTPSTAPTGSGGSNITPTLISTPTTTTTATPTLTNTPTSTVSASITPTPQQSTQLKICKFEDDNGDGVVNNGEGKLTWTFSYLPEGGQSKNITAYWWNVFTQGCVIEEVPAGARITVTEEPKSGWRRTAVYADGVKEDVGNSYTYSSERDRVKVLWFLNTFTPNSSITPTITTTPTVTTTLTLTPVPTSTPGPTSTPAPTSQAVGGGVLGAAATPTPRPVASAMPATGLEDLWKVMTVLGVSGVGWGLRKLAGQIW